MLILVAGAGGFIGGHLVQSLLDDGHEVRSIDWKEPDHWLQRHAGAEQIVADLNDPRTAAAAVHGCERVFNLACDMGGMGFIERYKARCMLSVLTNTHLVSAAAEAGVARYFFASTACVYPVGLQATTEGTSLRESDAYPPDPEDGYGWEKLFSERMCRHMQEDYGLDVRIARLHNVFGPFGTWRGGREKAPAAICRKVALAKLSGNHQITVWGDGNQRRSFLFIADAVEGIRRLMDSATSSPVNIGSDESVSISQLIDVVSDVAGITVERTYDLEAPQGVRGRSSDNTFAIEQLGWAPAVPLHEGIDATYRWVEQQVLVGRAELELDQ